MTSNVHPADELADVRSRIKVLEEREGQLREELLSGRVGLEGDDHVAQLVSAPRAWVNLNRRVRLQNGNFADTRCGHSAAAQRQRHPGHRCRMHCRLLRSING
jgi:hypothetical protein